MFLIPKPFHNPHFFFVGKRFQLPRPSWSSKGQIQTVTNQRSEGMQRGRKGSQEQQFIIWQCPGYSSRGIHIKPIQIFQLLYRNQGPHQAEDGNFRLSQTHRLLTHWNQKADIAVTSPTTSQRKAAYHTHTYAKLLQLCLTLCYPVEGNLPGSSGYGILQARILEWVAMPFSRGSSLPRDRNQVSCISCIGRRVLYHYCHLGNHTLHTSPQILTIKIVLRKQLERVQGFLSISCPGFLVWCLSLKCYTFFTMILCQQMAKLCM